MTTPNLAVATPVSRRTEPIAVIPEAPILAEGMTRLKQVLRELLADSSRPQATPIVGSYLALARRRYHRAQRVGYLPGSDQSRPAPPARQDRHGDD